MLLSGRFGNIRQKAPEDFNFTYSANANDSDLRADLITAGWNGTDAKTFNVTINSGVQLGSLNVGTPGLLISATWPAGSIINIENDGTINGRGGAGGGSSSNGGTGGNALTVISSITIPVNFDNSAGEINGGGGGGGGGGNILSGGTISCGGGECPVCNATGSCGGGVGGLGYGNAAAASGSAGGDPGSCPTCGGANSVCGGGGTGGSKGSTGNSGAARIAPGATSGAGIGGAAGSATEGDSKINFTATGAINGARNG